MSHVSNTPQRQPVFRSHALRLAISKLPCQRCGHPPDGSIVPAHYFGPRRHALGGGLGHKVSDMAAAALCQRCHLHMDTYQDGNTWERSEEFLFLILKTHIALADRGFVVYFANTQEIT